MTQKDFSNSQRLYSHAGVSRKPPKNRRISCKSPNTRRISNLRRGHQKIWQRYCQVTTYIRKIKTYHGQVDFLRNGNNLTLNHQNSMTQSKFLLTADVFMFHPSRSTSLMTASGSVKASSGTHKATKCEDDAEKCSSKKSQVSQN